VTGPVLVENGVVAPTESSLVAANWRLVVLDLVIDVTDADGDVRTRRRSSSPLTEGLVLADPD
jgi:hypothetical protein